MPDRVLRSQPQLGTSEAAGAPAGLSIVALSNILLRRRRLIAGLAIGLSLVSGLVALLKPRTYTVDASFIVQNSDRSSAAGLAAQLGVNVPGTDVSSSPAFFANLVKTPDVLTRLADTTFATRDARRARPLAEIWDIGERDPALTRDEVVTRLQKAIASSLGLKIDIVNVSVTTRDPVLSKGVADALLAQINQFNLQTRQSRATAERRFSEQRMNEVQGELRVAEESLQRFLEENRQDYLSPALEIEKGRRMRKIDLLQQTYTTLATAFERARIDEVRDTPVITIVHRPLLPVRPDSRGLASRMILMFALGLLGGAALALLREGLRWMLASDDDDAQEFSRLVTDTSQDVHRLREAFHHLPWRARRKSASE